MFSSVNKIHFIGIGGIGMSGIAEILLKQGFSVSGSDLNRSDIVEQLESKGAKIFIGHQAENVADAEVVVYSSAVNIKENPETVAAVRNNIPLIRRAEMLAEVSRLNYCLAISGTHGKTTTTSMCGLVLIEAGIDPTVIVGGRLKDFGGTNARLGDGKWTVVEADEFDRSFLQLSPTIAIINNIEEEHLDIYRDVEDIEQTFTEFASKIPFYGVILLGIDDTGVKNILPKLNKKVITFGLNRNCDIRGENLEFDGIESKCDVYNGKEFLGELKISIPGEHNLKNALAAVAAGIQMGIDFSIIQSALKKFSGIYRRFDYKGEYSGATVIDDYAHHPSEVKATLKGARRGWDNRIITVFQPHTFTRTRDQYKEFAQSFDNSDIVIITDIYPAREKPIEGIDGNLIAKSARQYGHKNIIYIPEFKDILPKLKEIITEGDLVFTLGAGNIWKIADELVS